MTPTEIKQLIDAMSDEDRFLAAAYLEHLANTKDEVHRMTLAKRMLRMDTGRKAPITPSLASALMDTRLTPSPLSPRCL
jgi:hypothetical protein